MNCAARSLPTASPCRKVRAWCLLVVAGLLGGSAPLEAADATVPAAPPPAEATNAAEPEPASFRVTGLGWWSNRELRRTLELLQPEDERLMELDAAFVEDAVVLLQSALERDGFLRSTGTVRLERAGENVGEYTWGPREVPTIPRDLAADHAVFALERGRRYTFARLEFTGLGILDEAAARSYFVEEGFLFGGGGTRRFTPSLLRRGVGNLREQLIRMGFIDARVTVESEERDDATGRVEVVINVEQGPRHRIDVVTPPPEPPAAVAQPLQGWCATAGGAVYSPLWRQDFLQAARNIYHEHGYADAKLELEPVGEPRPDPDGMVRHDFRLRAESGQQIHVGAVRFVGEVDVDESVLRRAARVRTGDLFDRGAIEQDRLKLGALGVFSSVRAEVDPADPDTWDIAYRVRPGKRLEASLLFGYGSYEHLRGGVEVVHANTFDHAHRGRLQLVYSQKSVHGDYLYTIPQIFGTSADVGARIFGLDRQEVSFDRREYGAGVGVRRRIGWLDADAALRYQFEAVNADIFDPTTAIDAPTDSNVASLTLDVTRDRLDNPIAPHRGQFIAFSLETATKAIGGEVDYQRLDLRASWHRRVGSEKYAHIGFRHGLVWALSGSAASDIPFARRYFPGGEGSVRGYVEGRASPRDAEGNTIGAEVSTIINLEFEQGLARSLSGVIFVDAGLTAASLADFPGDEWRVSAGIGLRFNTVIGPARLEYGHNVVRETGDARDAWHLALGFPF